MAVPECWLDVSRMADLEDVAEQFARAHGRRLRVATKYMNLTRRFFAKKGVTGYRIVESVGATEATPATGTSELIVDITSTGTTLKANNLKVLEDGLIQPDDKLVYTQVRKGASYEAVVDGDGWIVVGNQPFRTPSPALGSVVGTQIRHVRAEQNPVGGGAGTERDRCEQLHQVTESG